MTTTENIIEEGIYASDRGRCGRHDLDLSWQYGNEGGVEWRDRDSMRDRCPFGICSPHYTQARWW